MALYNVSVTTKRGTHRVCDVDYTSRVKAVAAFHVYAKHWITEPDACVSLGRLLSSSSDYRSFRTLAVKYTDKTRVELTPDFYSNFYGA